MFKILLKKDYDFIIKVLEEQEKKINKLEDKYNNMWEETHPRVMGGN